MAGDDDIEREIAEALPPPPPAAPARREAAIAMALQRFDGDEQAVVPKGNRSGNGTADRRPARHWLLGGPQLAGLMTVSLVLLIGVPVAWRALESGNVPGALAPHATKPYITSIDVPVRGASVARTDASKATAAPGTASSATPNAAAPTAPAAPRASGTEPSPPLAMAPTAPPAFAPIVAPAPSPPPPPPPPAPAPAPAIGGRAPVSGYVAERAAGSAGAAEDRSIIVTGRRTQSGAGYLSMAGDWNACTIHDPRQSLAACRSQINPAASGSKGQSDAYLADGLTQAWQGDAQIAMTAFDRAIALSPKSAMAWLNRALAHADAGDTNEALTDVATAARLAPNSARIHYAYGRLLHASGNERRARAEFERAAQIDPSYAALDD
ncbi:tetratricopeptide repeat protein [Novosphingobium sp. BL-8A]|uniref:tetratricopeptide repeat protein n=1 Tax=Novosphingobium sp. BL-8A TaxID=3127639 RepID=UPI003757A005